MPLADTIRKIIREQFAIEVFRVLELSEDEGRVTLDDGTGDPLNDIPCLASYYPREVGDQVTVLRILKTWVVLGANAKPPHPILTEDQVQEMITEAMPDVPPTVTIKWGKSKPSGDGWIQATDYPYVHDDGSGNRTVYFYTGTPPVEPPPETDPPDPTPPPPPPDKRPKTVTISPNSHGSWRSNGQTSDAILQGNASAWGGSSAYWTGAMFYGTKIRDACKGRTVKKMEMTVARTSGAGWNSKTPVRVGTHHRQEKNKVNSLDNVVTGTKLAWGGKDTFTLPSGIANKLAAGDEWGLGVSDHGSSNYMKLTSGSGTLKITFA